ncbi:MAG TPA: hypothetical protein VF221_05620 [Chloroflexota bacterium]
MLNRRYVYTQAGRIAAPIFAFGGLIGGAAASLVIAHAPPLAVNAVLWAAIGAVVAFMVFASEGPQQRPGSTAQGAIADGVVTGMIAGAAGAALDTLAANAAGTSNSHLTLLGFAGAFLAGLLAGGAVGAALGYVAVLVGGTERFDRPGPGSRRRTKRAPSPASGQAQRRRPQKKRSRR